MVSAAKSGITERFHISRVERLAFFAALLAGLLAHGYALVNPLLYHDAVYFINDFGGTFSLGRWMLGVLEIVSNATVGVYAPPLISGIISLVLIAATASLLVRLWRITSPAAAVIIGALMTAFPAVTSLFAYMYTAPAYCLALFLGVLAVYLLNQRQSVLRLCIAALLIAMSVGIYQAYLAMVLSVALITAIVNIVSANRGESARKTLMLCLWYLGMVALGMALYLLLNKICLQLSGESLSTYQGVNEMGRFDFAKLPALLLSTYRELFIQTDWSGANSFMLPRRMVQILLFLDMATLAVMVFARRMSLSNRVLLAVLGVLLPVAINSIYLYSTNEGYFVHMLMRYSLVCALIFLPVLLNQADNSEKAPAFMQKAHIYAKRGALGICALLCAGYIYFDNAAYQKMDLLQEQAAGYYSTLISQIRNTDEYKDELPVAYIGEQNIHDQTFDDMPFFDNIYIIGYAGDIQSLLNDYAWRQFMGRRCGFSPVVADDLSGLSDSDAIKAMPIYPDKGSIRVVDGVVVVKFAEH